MRSTTVNIDEAWQVFDGVVLSDGSISPQPSRFMMSLVGLDHVDWLERIKTALITLGVPVPFRYPTASWVPAKQKYRIYLNSRLCPLMDEQRSRWYPDGTKEAPGDLAFGPEGLANELMGDGSSAWARGNPDFGTYVVLCTQGFNLSSVGIVEDKLKQLGLFYLSRSHRLVRRGAGIVIVVTGTSASRLADLVEPYILPSYLYKVKKPGTRARTYWRELKSRLTEVKYG